MTLTPSLPTGAPAGLPLLAERRIWAGTVARAADGTPRTGVLPAHLGPLVTGKASMGYNIAELVAVTSRSLPGVEFVANDGTADLSPSGYAAPTANSRLDVIWVRSRFGGFGDVSEAPEFGITQGAASPTPVKPSLPAGALELAIAEVKATDTTTQTVVITQTARFTAMAGGAVALRSATEQAAWNPADGATAYRIDTGVRLVRSGGVWAADFSGSTDWIPLNLLTGWTATGGHTPRIRLLNGVEWIEGAATRGAGGALNAIAEIPDGFGLRPRKTVFYGSSVALLSGSTAASELICSPSGVIQVGAYSAISGAAGWVVPLSGSFPQEL